MASETSFSPGQRLRATLVAIQTGSTVRSILNTMEPVRSHPDDELANQMIQALTEAVNRRRTGYSVLRAAVEEAVDGE